LMRDPYYFGWEAIGNRIGLSESRVRRYKNTLLSFVEWLHPPADVETDDDGYDAEGSNTRRRKVPASRQSSLDNCVGSLTAQVSSAHSIGGKAAAAERTAPAKVGSSPGAGSNASNVVQALVAKED
jgi:hypothetical protein